MYEEITITSMDPRGNGLAIHDGATIIVQGALVGDVVSCHIVHKSPHRPLYWARVTKYHHKSPDHQKPSCHWAAPTAGKCGGCPLMHMRADAQYQVKLTAINEAFQREKINQFHELKITHAKTNLYYRNRSDFIIGKNKKNRTILGSYIPRTHDLTPMQGCRVLRNPLARISRSIEALINLQNCPLYNPKNKTGLRYLSLFANQKGYVLVDLICGSMSISTVTHPSLNLNIQTPAHPPSHWLEQLVESLLQLKEIKGISVSKNDSNGNVIHTQKPSLFYGQHYLLEKIGHAEVACTPSSFTQLNSELCAIIYERARTWVGKRHTVWDLYCGAGAFGKNILPQQIYGVDYAATSIELARSSPKICKHTNYEIGNLSTDVTEEKIPALSCTTSWPKPDLILVNPPRCGLSNAVIQTLRNTPCDVLYMSCDPNTFAKNTASLRKTHELVRAEAFDMLPNTTHVELLGLFCHTKNNNTLW